MSRDTALLVIDMQANMFDPVNPVADSDGLRTRVAALVSRARSIGVPVCFVRNCGGQGDPDQTGTPGWELHPDLAPRPSEMVLDKTTCDAFASTTLGAEFESLNVRHVVITGLQSEFCIRETALGALALGLRVTLVEDGHSTFAGGGRTAEVISAGVADELAGRVRLVPSDSLELA